MRWSNEEASKQINNLIAAYPQLKMSTPYLDNSEIQLAGSLNINRSAFNYIVQKEYPIEITIPLGNSDLPRVRETGNMIASDYPHRYDDGTLCIETDTSMLLYFIDGFDLVEWIEAFVEPYFFSYEYHSRFGVFPFGERPHHIEGIIDTYKELFHCDNLNQALRLLKYAAEDTYRGHDLCPCCSGKKLRNCHGKQLLPFMTDTRKKDIALSNMQYLRKEFLKIEQSKTNYSSTK